MFNCNVCFKNFDDENSLKRHFHVTSQDKQHIQFLNEKIKLAEGLFVSEPNKNTVDILSTHPELNILSERFLRKLWTNLYGQTVVVERLAEISKIKSKNTLLKQSQQTINKKCPICNFIYTKESSFSHHILGAKDDHHFAYLNEQKNIAKTLFLIEKTTDKILSEHPEFNLSRKFLFKFWKDIYTKKERDDRSKRVISISKITLNLSKEDLEKLYLNDKLLEEEIAKKYKVKTNVIHSLRQKYNIKTLENWERYLHQTLTEEEKDICLGLMLGDGHFIFREHSKNAGITVKHSIKQKEYAVWLCNKLIRWISNRELYPKYKKDSKPHPITGKIYENVIFDTIYHPVFNEIYNLFYKNKVKTIDLKYVDKHLNALSLAVWLMDDGSCDKKSGSIRLYTNGFSVEEVEGLRKVLKQRGYKTYLMKIKIKNSDKFYPVIQFDRLSSIRVAQDLEKYIIPSMDYKIRPTLMIHQQNNINKNNIVFNNEIKINSEEWSELNKKFGREDIKKLIIDAVKKYELTFPYKKITEMEALNDFKQLINLDTKKNTLNGYFFTKSNYKKYNRNMVDDYFINSNYTGNISSNYFQQINRLNNESVHALSPINAWQNEKVLKSALGYIWRMKITQVNNNILRDCLTLSKYTASQFRPSAAKYIYDNYSGSGKVLDFSAGWGDRLAGFYASSKTTSYTGIDPNTEVFKIYQTQADKYAEWGNIKKETNFINMPAEDVILNDQFDLIFTSPPFFDQERYCNEETQSWKRYKTREEWLEKFLFKTIENFWNNNLKIGGYLILNIADVYGHHKIQQLCDPMNEFISKLPGAQFENMIGYKLSKRPNSKSSKIEGVLAEPIWIWKKVS